MALTLEEKDAKEWTYRGEGAANLVLSYCGSSPHFAGKVIRVQKALKKALESMVSSSVLSASEQSLWEDTPELATSTSKEILTQLFMLYVMSPLLGSEHVDPGKRILVSREFLESIEKSVLSQRPPWRVDAAMVNILCDSVLLMSDHSMFPQGTLKEESCIAVEIKQPKCGFLPSSRFIAERNSVKKRIPRFKMHQVLKLCEGEVSKASTYDPLDLFSGSRYRISQAIGSLFATPQNNFRVFLNGSLVFGGSGGRIDDTESVADPTCDAKKGLERLLKDVIHAEFGRHVSCFLELVSETISRSGIFDRLLEAQKFDIFDIEGAIHAYYDIISQPCLVCQSVCDAEILQSNSIIHSLPLEEKQKIVKDYLVSATAKDCSLMISFLPREDGNSATKYSSVVLESTNQSFDYKKTVVSVDLVCSKCKKKVMKQVAGLEGINSIVLDPTKSTVTVIGEADPVHIIREVRKFRKSAQVVSVGPPKEEKKDEKKLDAYCIVPKTCQKCDTWYVISQDRHSYCPIL